MVLQHFSTHDRDCFVWRKVMMVVLQHKEVQRRNQSIGIVPGNQIHLPLFKGPRQQSQIHDARRSGKTKSVAGDEPFVSIGTLHEFVSETGAPLWRKLGGLRQRLQLQMARVIAADHHGEGVIESKRWPYAETELCFVVLLHSPIDLLLVAARPILISLLPENGC